MIINQVYVHKFLANLEHCQDIIFFGAGLGGGKAYILLHKYIKGCNVYFCDNSIEKIGKNYFGRKVLSVKEAVACYPSALYIVSFKDNVNEKFRDVQNQLIANGVRKEKVKKFYYKKLYKAKSDYFLKLINFCRFMQLFIFKRKKRKIISIKKVITLTTGIYAPKGGVGGNSAGVTCQKVILGDKYNEIDLEYGFGQENKYTVDYKNPYAWLFQRIQYVLDIIKNEKNVGNIAYIAHDYITGFALSVAGATYRMIYHHQGSALEERKHFGVNDDFTLAHILMHMEKEAFYRAEEVHFPSDGAKYCFDICRNKKVDLKKVKIGINLPVTIWGNGEVNELEKIRIETKENAILILSIGQMSMAKGMDLVPQFLKEMLVQTKRNIHWIVVANGVMNAQVLQSCDILKRKYSNFDYTHFAKCTYSEIQALHQLADIYLMLHRISIFDIATLEAMKYGETIILSKVGGNLEYNMQNNIILVDNTNWTSIIKEVLTCNSIRKDLNRIVYDKYFSPESYKKRYYEMLRRWKGIYE